MGEFNQEKQPESVQENNQKQQLLYCKSIGKGIITFPNKGSEKARNPRQRCVFKNKYNI
jgi:hypothetical protein